MLIALGVQSQKLGFIGGPSMNYGLIWSENSDASYKPLPGPGFHAGGLFEWDITNRWGWDAALMYDMRSSNFNMNYAQSDTTTFFSRQLFYMNVPVHIYVNVPIRNKYVFSFFIGPSLGVGLHGRDAAWMMLDNKKPVTSQDEEMYDKDNGRVTRWDIAAEVGMAFKYKAYQVRLAYQHSLNNSTKNGYQYTMPFSKSVDNFYTQGSLRLSFAYLFDLSK